MTVLITGGAGYVGSHTAPLILKVGGKVVVYDNLTTGDKSFVASGAYFEKGDIRDRARLEEVIQKYGIQSIIHLAAYIEVAESMRNPLKYYENNVGGTIAVVEAALHCGVKNFVFSSTAAVYGTPENAKVTEESKLAPASPYGYSKLMGEQILSDASRAHGLKVAILRYFNVVGVDQVMRYGYTVQKNPAHLVRKALAVAVGREEALPIFGTDYLTHDGTAIRDYIHVNDVALAHAHALSHLMNEGASDVFNVGYGRGRSVYDIVAAVEQLSGKELPMSKQPRRPGDVASIVADSTKIRTRLGWTPSHENGLEHMLDAQYRFELSRA